MHCEFHVQNSTPFFRCVCFVLLKSMESSHLCGDQNLQQWLKEVFQNEDIPSFDETPEFIETLKTFMAGNEVAEKDAKAIIKAEKNLKSFYDEKTKELQLVTDFIQLNSETCQRVESLATLAEKMKLKEPSLTNFVLGMTEIEDQELVNKEKMIITNHHLSVFSKKLVHTGKMNEKLRRYLKSLTKVVETQKAHYESIDKEMKYFKEKKDQLNRKIMKDKKILETAGYEEGKGYRHSDLVEKGQKLKELEEQLKTLENKLQAYHSLPANFTETANNVKDKEDDLIKLESELQLLIQAYEKL